LPKVSEIGPISGLIVFFIGICLLIFTFFTGYTFVTNPSSLRSFGELIPDSAAGSVGSLGAVIRIPAYLIPVTFLFALGYVAAKISAQGIQMFRTQIAREETQAIPSEAMKPADSPKQPEAEQKP